MKCAINKYIDLLLQLCRFGIVGVAATVVHVVVGLSLEKSALLEAFWANFVAFLIAFMVSYSGQRKWTFASDAKHADVLPKFFTTALVGLVLNQVIVYLFVNQWSLPYEHALPVIILSVPVICFLLSKFWVFKEKI